MVRLVKKFFREFDMFSSFATLRTKGEPETSNTCAGVLSLLILIIFIYLFISQFVAVTNWDQVTSIETQNNTFDSGRAITKFMVGVGVEGFRIQGVAQYMRFQIVEVTKNASATLSTRKLRTEKCTRAHWAELGSQLEQNYKSFNLENKICLAPDQTYSIEQPNNGVYRLLVAQINACRRLYYSNRTMMYSYCADENLTRYRNQLYVQANKYFLVNVVYLNTAFNPLNKKPTSIYMQATRLTFTMTQGAQAFVSLSTFSIQTDSSILPYQQVDTENGQFVHQINSNNFQAVVYFEHASCTFSLSSNSLLVTRSIGKLDQILSYAGGLFGIIISFLSFFMMSFNKYRYELMVAQSAFNYNQDGKKIKEEGFTFPLYIKYQVFDWIKTLTCHELNWKDCQEIDETREQAVNQLDIRLMFKKLQYFERFIEYIISDKEKIGLFLTEPPSIEKIRLKRMIVQYYDKIIQGKPAVTIEDLNVVTGIFEFVNGLANAMENSGSKGSLSSEELYTEREDILEYSLEKYEQMRSEQEQAEQIIFDEEENAIERYIALAFFTIPEASRKKIQKKIPLKILRRLNNIKNSQTSTSVMSINLEI